MKKEIHVGIVQQTNSTSIQENMEKLAINIQACVEAGAELIVLQELHNSLYFCQVEDTNNFDLAETIPGKSTHFYGEIAKKHKVVLVTSLFEKRAPGIYHNTAVVFEADGTIAGKYRKMHIPDDPAYYEKFYFTPGDLGFTPIQTSLGKLGVLVCWDQWYPEAARLTALQGSEILFYPTAIGWHPEEKAEVGNAQHQAWQTMQRSHAIANGCYVAAVNRIGFEPDPTGSGGIEFWGQSFIAAPDGSIVCEAPPDRECVLVEELDLGALARQRHGWPFFRDRRIDAYKALTKRFLVK